MKWQMTAIFFLLSCASSTSSVDMIDPVFRVRLADAQTAAGIQPQRGAVLTLSIDVGNRSGETLTLERLSLQSFGGGAFEFQSTSRIFHAPIASHATASFDMDVTVADDSPEVNADAPVTVRGTAILRTPGGQRVRKVFLLPLVTGRDANSPR